MGEIGRRMRLSASCVRDVLALVRSCAHALVRVWCVLCLCRNSVEFMQFVIKDILTRYACSPYIIDTIDIIATSGSSCSSGSSIDRVVKYFDT